MTHAAACQNHLLPFSLAALTTLAESRCWTGDADHRVPGAGCHSPLATNAQVSQLTSEAPARRSSARSLKRRLGIVPGAGNAGGGEVHHLACLQAYKLASYRDLNDGSHLTVRSSHHSSLTCPLYLRQWTGMLWVHRSSRTGTPRVATSQSGDLCTSSSFCGSSLKRGHAVELRRPSQASQCSSVDTHCLKNGRSTPARRDSKSH